MINGPAIARMERGVMLINTSRGALIDTVAVIEALKIGKIGYLGLDVYEEEEEIIGARNSRSFAKYGQSDSGGAVIIRP